MGQRGSGGRAGFRSHMGHFLQSAHYGLGEPIILSILKILSGCRHCSKNTPTRGIGTGTSFLANMLGRVRGLLNTGLARGAVRRFGKPCIYTVSVEVVEARQGAHLVSNFPLLQANGALSTLLPANVAAGELACGQARDKTVVVTAMHSTAPARNEFFHSCLFLKSVQSCVSTHRGSPPPKPLLKQPGAVWADLCSRKATTHAL